MTASQFTELAGWEKAPTSTGDLTEVGWIGSGDLHYQPAVTIGPRVGHRLSDEVTTEARCGIPAERPHGFYTYQLDVDALTRLAAETRLCHRCFRDLYLALGGVFVSFD